MNKSPFKQIEWEKGRYARNHRVSILAGPLKANACHHPKWGYYKPDSPDHEEASWYWPAHPEDYPSAKVREISLYLVVDWPVLPGPEVDLDTEALKRGECEIRVFAHCFPSFERFREKWPPELHDLILGNPSDGLAISSVNALPCPDNIYKKIRDMSNPTEVARGIAARVAEALLTWSKVKPEELLVSVSPEMLLPVLEAERKNNSLLDDILDDYQEMP